MNIYLYDIIGKILYGHLIWSQIDWQDHVQLVCIASYNVGKRYTTFLAKGHSVYYF